MDWIMPVDSVRRECAYTLTRDSNLLEQSNWDHVVKKLGEENDETYLILRFGHWACGWVQHIAINPERKDLCTLAQNLIDSTADYPVLNDEDYSQRVYDDACSFWDGCSTKEKIGYCRKANASIFQARFTFDSLDSSTLQELIESEIQ